MSRPAHFGKWGQRGKLVQERVPDKHCRWCGDPIPKETRRTSYCSADCYRECWLRISWPTMRNHIMARDVVCRICEGASYSREVSWTSKHYDYAVQGYVEFSRVKAEWHVDHVTPVVEGGTDDPDNLRLLCGRCHKRITKEWHGERARQRKSAQPQTLELSL